MQNTVLTGGDGFDRAVDSISLVVAGLLTRCVFVIGLKDRRFFGVFDTPMSFVPPPKESRSRECIKRKLGFDVLSRSGHLVVGREGIAIGTKGAGDIEDFRVAKCLL
jgi:hypothetical protein